MKVSDYVIEFLADHDVKHMFFLPGGGCMHLAESLGSSSRVMGVSLLHEQAAAIAAEGYAFNSEKVGACLVTTGPGGTNAVTAVQSSYTDSTPVFFVSGQVKTTDLKGKYGVRSHGSQESGIVDIVKTITKYSVLIMDKNDIRYELEKAWDEMTNGRKGPVWVDIPLDIQGAQIEPKDLRSYVSSHNIDEYECPDELISESIEQILKAKRPVIMTGNGLLDSKELFYEFADVMECPIIPSWKLPDIICNDHRLYAGKCGTLGDRAGNYTMQNADLIISLGCRLDFSITGWDRAEWAPNAYKIVVDIDQHELDKLGDSAGVDLPICCDVKSYLYKILLKKEEYCMCSNSKQLCEWWKHVKEWKDKYPLITDEKYLDANGLSDYAVVETVANELDCDAVIISSNAGNVAEIVFQSFPLKTGQKMRGSHGLGAMGYEIPNSIGAYYATGKQIVCFAGDGGMQLNIQDLATIVGRNMPIKIFIIENTGYASIQNMQRNHFDGHYVASEAKSGMFVPDMVALGRAYGFEVYETNEMRTLSNMVKKTLKEKGPSMCVCHCDPMCLVEPRSATQVMPDGTLKSSTLYNQYPFLSEEEEKANCIGE